ncbi:hypothetical protein AB0N07_48220 [Streptomyces sp. NPDC051172]|uniref:hypothetical protein n=1 Tax=Streptomyces sp. NPDC051172 TaxID=3155796 RepID=UPI00341E15D1
MRKTTAAVATALILGSGLTLSQGASAQPSHPTRAVVTAVAATPSRASVSPQNDAGKIFTLKDGQCKSEGSFYAITASYMFSYSQQTKGHCWHWTRLWFHNYEKHQNYVLKAEGTKAYLHTPYAATGNYMMKKGNMPYAAEFGLCGGSGHCVVKKATGVKPNW